MKHNNPSSPPDSQNVAVVGARGYTGLELARYLIDHPYVNQLTLFSTQSEFSPDLEIPRIRHEISKGRVRVLPFEQSKTSWKEYQAIFLATPHEVSKTIVAEWMPEILAAPTGQSMPVLVDLSNMHRLPSQLPKSWAPDVLYGVSPWASLEIKERRPKLISNPGCYATSAILALIPIVRMLQSMNARVPQIAVDGKSGTTGAGRSAQESLLFSEVADDFVPYRVGTHQHFPEILHYVEKYSSKAVSMSFLTSLLPIRRGISTSIFMDLTGLTQVGLSDEDWASAIEKSLQDCYGAYPLLYWENLQKVTEPVAKKILSLRRVVESPFTQLAFKVVGQKLYFFSMIDNLCKGASTQAIENWNAYHGWPLELGLLAFDKEGGAK